MDLRDAALTHTRRRTDGVRPPVLLLYAALAVTVLICAAACRPVRTSGGTWALPAVIATPSPAPDDGWTSDAVAEPLASPSTSRHGSYPSGRAGPTANAFVFAQTGGSVLGHSGALRRYRVAVEQRSGVDPEDFAEEVERILGDRRSWIAGGDVRLQRVPAASSAEFTIYLASASTTDRICRAGGVNTRRYTSCRLSGKVVLNLDRWNTAIAGYGASLEEYRSYALNHEVGHQLGHRHETCPGAGRPAPVMQQQTLGLKGCVANGWPYIDGHRYSGPLKSG